MSNRDILRTLEDIRLLIQILVLREVSPSLPLHETPPSLRPSRSWSVYGHRPDEENPTGAPGTAV